MNTKNTQLELINNAKTLKGLGLPSPQLLLITRDLNANYNEILQLIKHKTFLGDYNVMLGMPIPIKEDLREDLEEMINLLSKQISDNPSLYEINKYSTAITEFSNKHKGVHLSCNDSFKSLQYGVYPIDYEEYVLNGLIEADVRDLEPISVANNTTKWEIIILTDTEDD